MGGIYIIYRSFFLFFLHPFCSCVSKIIPVVFFKSTTAIFLRGGEFQASIFCFIHLFFYKSSFVLNYYDLSSIDVFIISFLKKDMRDDDDDDINPFLSLPPTTNTCLSKWAFCVCCWENIRFPNSHGRAFPSCLRLRCPHKDGPDYPGPVFNG